MTGDRRASILAHCEQMRMLSDSRWIVWGGLVMSGCAGGGPGDTTANGSTTETGLGSESPTETPTGAPSSTDANGGTQSSADATDTHAATDTASTATTSMGTTSVATTSIDTGTTGELHPPEAPVLQLSFSQIKQFDFTWPAASGAAFYRLLERPGPDGEYGQIGGDIVDEAVSCTMPLHFRFDASYILRACNADGCTDSDAVDVVDSLASAVGYIKASNTDTGDTFGESVALSADGNTLAVGAYIEASASTGINGAQADDSAAQAGAVYVFVRAGDTWVQQAYVKASNTDADDSFGGEVALSADGNTLAVGASREDSAAKGINGSQADDTAPQAGAVYVFTRAGDTWSQQAYVKASNAGGADFFGASVALSTDGDTLAVGAHYESSAATGIGGNQADNSAFGAGAVYVFVRNDDTWSQQAYIKASNAGSSDLFGITLALSGDGNTLAVGASFEESGAVGINGNQADNSANDAGAVYVFTRAGNTWSQQAYVKASNTDAGDNFGKSAALSANGDTLAVGAYFESSAASGINGDQADDSAPRAGAAYVFTRTGNNWTQQAYIKASNPDSGDDLGFNGMALSADGNTLAVGAEGEDGDATGINGDPSNSAGGAGAAYVFVRTDDSWSQRAYVKASNAGEGDNFGISVALSGDGSLLAVGAYRETSAATGISGDQSDDSVIEAGAVYLY
jgi:hypothetical protein